MFGWAYYYLCDVAFATCSLYSVDVDVLTF